jgi:hypothetical protein
MYEPLSFSRPPQTMSLRQLFQTFRLEVRFDKPSHRANCQVTIDDDSVAALGSDSDKHSVSPGWCTDVGSAPGGNRKKGAHDDVSVSRTSCRLRAGVTCLGPQGLHGPRLVSHLIGTLLG